MVIINSITVFDFDIVKILVKGSHFIGKNYLRNVVYEKNVSTINIKHDTESLTNV